MEKLQTTTIVLKQLKNCRQQRKQESGYQSLGNIGLDAHVAENLFPVGCKMAIDIAQIAEVRTEVRKNETFSVCLYE